MVIFSYMKTLLINDLVNLTTVYGLLSLVLSGSIPLLLRIHNALVQEHMDKLYPYGVIGIPTATTGHANDKLENPLKIMIYSYS